jgi:hypothetical protein
VEVKAWAGAMPAGGAGTGAMLRQASQEVAVLAGLARC